ncbi:hypothetical protein NDU88_003489 [Pleurodeles waltl]|uniref:Protein phosphatase 1 regulatory subunit 12A n=1 Tax=Pleurodeles waltl TaxID=8319 RepID=A0AAV7TNQ1_PLEWA|nr:hypothetical protein NDU88_003489 [Pleurodeles waltl]
MAAADDRSRSDAAKLKRREQLSRWRASEEEAAGGGQARGSAGRAPRSRVSFAQGAVFMAACSAGDRAEVKELLAAGAPINGTNVDGLTALHQVRERRGRAAGATSGQWGNSPGRLAGRGAVERLAHRERQQAGKGARATAVAGETSLNRARAARLGRWVVGCVYT